MSNYLSVYRPSYSRALQKYADSGFTARALDADDHAFIETVRERGNIACGSLANLAPDMAYANVVPRSLLIDEAEFWQNPSAFEFGLAGWRLRQAMQRAISAHDAETNAKIRTRIEQRRAEDRRVTAAELANEQGRWTAAQRKTRDDADMRRKRWMAEEAEWRDADRNLRSRGQLRADLRKSRFYVPIWKLEEHEAAQAAEQAAAEQAAEEQRQAAAAAKAAEAERAAAQAAEHQRAIDRAVADDVAAEMAAVGRKIPMKPEYINGRRMWGFTLHPELWGGQVPDPDDWQDLDWWPPVAPDISRMHRIGGHFFCRNDDLQAILLTSTFGHRLRIVRYGAEMCHLALKDSDRFPFP